MKESQFSHIEPLFAKLYRAQEKSMIGIGEFLDSFHSDFYLFQYPTWNRDIIRDDLYSSFAQGNSLEICLFQCIGRSLALLAEFEEDFKLAYEEERRKKKRDFRKGQQKRGTGS